LNKKYKVIYADPPWQFRVWSNKGKEKSAEQHYQVMKLNDIKNLDIQSISDDDSILFMWATYPNLEEAFEVIKSWGFRYKTVAFTWAKTTKNDKWHIGCGYYTRANPEICLLATKGKIPKRKSKSIRNLVISKIREHSRKPDVIYDYIENLFDGPYIELFARNTREGWDNWGNELDTKIEIEFRVWH
jgi:N6-adenosine-specific RNA methylase IME4